MTAAASAALALAVALSFIACSDDTEESDGSARVTPTASGSATARTALPTPTPQPTAAETGGLDGFRIFAGQIAAALDARDGTTLAARAYPEVAASSGDVVGHATPDEVRAAFERLVSEARADKTDEFGTGAARLHALTVARYDPYYGQSPFDGQAPHQALVTAIIQNTYDSRFRRTLVIYEFVFKDGLWRLAGVSRDPGLSTTQLEDWLSGTCRRCGGETLWTWWEPWQATK